MRVLPFSASLPTPSALFLALAAGIRTPCAHALPPPFVVAALGRAHSYSALEDHTLAQLYSEEVIDHERHHSLRRSGPPTAASLHARFVELAIAFAFSDFSNA